MAGRDPLLEGVLELHRSLQASQPLSEALDRVAHVATATVPGADMAGLTLLEGTDPVTVAHAGAAARDLDAAQYRSGRGPCLHAFRTCQVVHVADVDRDERWPEYSATAADNGVKSSLSTPLIIDGEGLGALNLYARTTAAFDAHAQETAAVFAEQAAIAVGTALTALHAEELIGQLEEALQSRDVIGQAKGILMAQRRITAEAAFAELRRVSSQLNRKLRDVAADVAITGGLPTDGR